MTFKQLMIGGAAALAFLTISAGIAAADQSQGRVEAGQSVEHPMIAQANHTSQVTLVGDGDTDLDHYVYDPNGALVCQSLGMQDRESCAVPNNGERARYRIVISNLGDVWNAYTLTAE